MTNYINHKNGRIAYDVTGSGPLVVCIPSLGDVRAEYRFLVPHLTAAGYRVATMDVRGHGETSVGWEDYSVAGIGEDALALIRELNAGPAILIGTSMGGGAAVWAAVEAPEWVRALVLVDPFVDGDSDRLLVFALSILFARPWGTAMWGRYYASLYPTQKPADFDEYVRNLRANLNQPGRLEAVVAMLRASKQASGRRLAQVNRPALVMMGSKDPDFKQPEVEALRVAQAVRGTCQMVPGAGHYPHTEMPEAAAGYVLDFLKSLRNA